MIKRQLIINRFRYESMSQRLTRRMSWLGELIELEDWRGISMMSSRILNEDDELTREMRIRFMSIESAAGLLASPDDGIGSGDSYLRASSDMNYQECIQSYVGVVNKMVWRKF